MLLLVLMVVMGGWWLFKIKNIQTVLGFVDSGKIRSDMISLGAQTVTVPDGVEATSLEAVFDRLDNQEFAIKNIKGEVIATGKLAFRIWYLDPDNKSLKSLRAVVVAEMPDGKFLVTSKIWGLYGYGTRGVINVKDVENYFNSRLKRGKSFSINFFPNYKSVRNYYDTYHIDKLGDENLSLNFQLQSKYLENVVGNWQELISKRWNGNEGYMLPINYSGEAFFPEGVYLGTFDKNSQK